MYPRISRASITLIPVTLTLQGPVFQALFAQITIMLRREVHILIPWQLPPRPRSYDLTHFMRYAMHDGSRAFGAIDALKPMPSPFYPSYISIATRRAIECRVFVPAFPCPLPSSCLLHCPRRLRMDFLRKLPKNVKWNVSSTAS